MGENSEQIRGFGWSFLNLSTVLKDRRMNLKRSLSQKKTATFLRCRFEKYGMRLKLLG